MPDEVNEQNEERRFFEFRFKGYDDFSYKNDDRYKNNDRDVSLATVLNEHRDEIAEEILSIVESLLNQPEILFKAEIDFFEGSIEWIGAVVLIVSGMNLLSAISGTADFFEKVAKLIEFAVESSVRKSIARTRIPIRTSSFNMQVMRPVFPSQSLQQESQPTLLRFLPSII